MPYKSHLTLGARVGGGQFGDVYEGQDQVHGKVAVKVLKQKIGESTADWATRSAALLKEAQHLKAATHPNVVQVHNIVRDSNNDVLHLVTEFCDGGSIDTPYQNGPLTLPHVRKIITGACRGLEHIHSRGMVHRDIKPGNILRHGTAYKIADFGLVSDTLLLGYASADGYLCHLAPEVFGNPATSTPGVTSCKTDVWAMGMTVYRLLSGHPWFLRNFAGLASAHDIRQMIIDGGFCRGLDWLPHVPEPWRKFVRKAMHDETVHRFQTALATCPGPAPDATPLTFSNPISASHLLPDGHALLSRHVLARQCGPHQLHIEEHQVPNAHMGDRHCLCLRPQPPKAGFALGREQLLQQLFRAHQFSFDHCRVHH